MTRNKNYQYPLFHFTLPLILFLFIGCQFDSSGQYVYKQPEQTQDGLEVGSLKEVDIELIPLTDAMNMIEKGKFREVHSMLIYRKNKLVFEEYFPGHEYQWDAPYHHGDWVSWNKDILHMVASDTKSLTSLCIGIAIDHGFITSVHQSIFDYLPQYQYLNKDGRDKITIEHLLTMTSGFDANEWTSSYSNLQNPVISLWFPPCEDPIACILERPLVNEPGSKFNYYGGNMILLGEIIKNASGMTIDKFSKKYLFEPIGIDTVNWSLIFPNGAIEAAGGLVMKPRDMLKIGVLFLNNGTWDDQQIVSKQWIERSGTAYNNNEGINIPGMDSGRHGYSYSWWTKSSLHKGKTINIFSAIGWGGQYIIVMPELETVVVFTGGTYTSSVKTFNILQKYIIPAMY